MILCIESIVIAPTCQYPSGTRHYEALGEVDQLGKVSFWDGLLEWITFIHLGVLTWIPAIYEYMIESHSLNHILDQYQPYK